MTMPRRRTMAVTAPRRTTAATAPRRTTAVTALRRTTAVTTALRRTTRATTARRRTAHERCKRRISSCSRRTTLPGTGLAECGRARVPGHSRSDGEAEHDRRQYLEL